MSGTMAIAELVTVCERMAAVNRTLFETLGAWVADEPDPAAQRTFATMAHRHAWHAELWAERRPTIPLDASAEPVTLPEPGSDRLAWYRAVVESLRADLAAIEQRVETVLDPSTARVVALVRADLP